MIETEEILSRTEKCKPLIRNWEALDGIDFDYRYVRIDGVLVDRHPDDKDENWEISLMTTMHTVTNEDGQDLYSVHWRFRDLWGNHAFFSFQGYELTGSLLLNYIDYGDFAIVGFSVVKSDGSPIFSFKEPDEIAIISVDKLAHLTLRDLYPEDYLPEEK